MNIMDTQIDLYKTILYDYKYFINTIKNDTYHFIIYKNITDIPNNIKYLEFYNEYMQILKKGDIPNSVTHLLLDGYYNQELKDIIPNSVTHLEFGYYFDQSLNEGDIPNSVTHLTFGYHFSKSLKEYIIPNSVTHIRFNGFIKQSLYENIIPQNVTHIFFKKYILNIYKIVLPKNIIEIIVRNSNDIYNIFQIKNKNINDVLVGYLYEKCKHQEDEPLDIYYVSNKSSISRYDKKVLDYYIDDYLTINKLKGRIIYKELLQKVLHPNNILHVTL